MKAPYFQRGGCDAQLRSSSSHFLSLSRPSKLGCLRSLVSVGEALVCSSGCRLSLRSFNLFNVLDLFAVARSVVSASRLSPAAGRPPLPVHECTRGIKFCMRFTF